MPTIASHNPNKMPIIRDEDILVLHVILEGKPAHRRPRYFTDSETITAPFNFCGSLLRANRAPGDPDLHLRRRVRPRKGRQGSAIPGVPAPADQIIIGYVVQQLIERATPILLWIFDLLAQISG